MGDNNNDGFLKLVIVSCVSGIYSSGEQLETASINS